MSFGDPDEDVDDRAGAAVEVTGLRNPCRQIDRFSPGLLRVALDQKSDGTLIRKVGVMAVVTRCGPVRPGMVINVCRPAALHRPLEPV